MSAPPPSEFSRFVRVDELGDGARERVVAATGPERAALARRFGLRALDRLEARAHVVPEAAGVRVTGTLVADLVQACVATGEDVPARLEVPFAVRFVRGLDADGSEEEIALGDEDCDLLPLDEARIDLGETVAQTLALNLDPYPRAPGADETLRALGVLREGEAGPLAAALRGLKPGKGAD